MATVTVNISVNKEGSIVVNPNIANASVGDSIRFISASGVKIDSITKNSGSDNVFEIPPSRDNNWTGVIASNVRGQKEKYTVKANGVSHDPEMDINS